MKSFCLVLLLALSATPACSHFTASGRMDRAYARQMKKIHAVRQQRLTRLRHEIAKMPKPQTPALSEPQMTMQTSEGPQAFPTESGNQ